jgi:cytochrome c oxidase cbb3-type subunit 3
MRRLTPLALILCLHTEACRDSNAQTTAARTAAASQGTDSSRLFVSHVEHIQPGGGPVPRGMMLRNPYEGSASAIAKGEKLFTAYNCIDCHGAAGSGAMGPSLADGRWHFGGTAPEVYESVYQGRPDGMPAWGSLLSSDQIWTLVTYVRSLERGKDVTTENFSGATVERTGH